MANLKFRRFSEVLLDFIEIATIGASVFILVYLFVGQLLEVSGDSMDPTLYNEEQIIAEKISLAFKPLERGEIVIFRHPEKQDRLLIKRVIGLPGDTFRFSDGNVILNDSILDEPYVDDPTYVNSNNTLVEEENYVIPEKAYLLLGDNRIESADSRSFGTIKQELIVGRALLVYHPVKNFRIIEH